MFSKGQKIICINDDFGNLRDLKKSELKYPKKDCIYTVREVSELGITLMEIVNEKYIFSKHGNLFTEPKFSASRFRPVFQEFIKIEFSEINEQVTVSAN